MDDYQGKKVAVLGLGIEGRDAIAYLANKNVHISVHDQKGENEIEGYGEISSKFKFETKFGPNYLDGLGTYDIIFRSPGVRRNIPELIEAEKKGVKITSSTIEFFENCPCPIIGITGTKGKGTTSTLIYQIIKNSGKKTFLAGNIGKPMLETLPQLDNMSTVVLELSSFQLQDLQKSPHVAVITNITVDHLDYHANREEYFNSKKNIILHQKLNDFAVINFEDESSMELARLAPGKVYYYGKLPDNTEGCSIDKDKFVIQLGDNKSTIASTSKLMIKGRHNWLNCAAAIVVSKILGINDQVIEESLYSFQGLEHRLEYVSEVNGVKYFNDSFGTTPETAIAAVKSFNQPIILIVGGSNKGSDYTELGKEIVHSNVKTVILIGEMAQKINEAIEKAGEFKGEIITGLDSMSKIVNKSQELAKSGDVVLLSPACASFDMFKNYKDRGNQFKSNVLSLYEK